MLDLANDDRPLFGALHIIEEILRSVADGTAHSTTADSGCRIAAGCNGGSSLFGCIDHRNYNAVRREVEVRLDEHRVARADADKSGAARTTKGDQVPLNVLDRVGSVLRIDPRKIHAAVARKFADDEIAHRYDAADRDASIFEIGEKPVFDFHFTYPLF